MDNAAIASIQPGQSVSALAFSGIAGFGFGAPFILIVGGVQLIVPHHLMATTTALLTSVRNIASTVFIAIYTATFTEKMASKLPHDVAVAAAQAGVPTGSVPPFVKALATGDVAALQTIPGVTASAVAFGTAAIKQAAADSIRYVYIIAAPFGVLATVACCFLDSLRAIMSYHVEAPVEALQAKNKQHQMSKSA